MKYCSIHAADFFTYQDPGGPFDIGYDYTFLCALHPDMRKDWATAWGKHLKPGGELVTLIFPVDPSADANLGPPWPVTPELYTQLLADSGKLQLGCEARYCHRAANFAFSEGHLVYVGM